MKDNLVIFDNGIVYGMAMFTEIRLRWCYIDNEWFMTSVQETKGQDPIEVFITPEWFKAFKTAGLASEHKVYYKKVSYKRFIGAMNSLAEQDERIL